MAVARLKTQVKAKVEAEKDKKIQKNYLQF
jgi:hypothetical protein